MRDHADHINMDTKVIEQAALSLPPNERAHLAQQLLSSLDTLSEGEIEEAWLDEAVDRAGEPDDGIVQAIPASEVRRKAKKLLR